MARKSSGGGYILSAAEIGTYSVCPESWRLRVVEGLEKSAVRDSVDLGNSLHKSWADHHKAALDMKRGINLLLLLIAHAIALSVFILGTK